MPLRLPVVTNWVAIPATPGAHITSITASPPQVPSRPVRKIGM